MNAMNILEISEDLQYLIQSNMEDQIYQIQRMLADKLDTYSRWGNQYMSNNIWKIQELYKDMEQKKESNEEVILIKPYEISKSILSMMKLTCNEVYEIYPFYYTNETI